MNRNDARARSRSMMPELLTELEALTRCRPSRSPATRRNRFTRWRRGRSSVLRDAGFANAELQDGSRRLPADLREVPGPEGSPTVMLYAHYDVQPAPPEQDWTSDPWTPTRKDDGRMYGRGIADDKSGLVIHAGTLKAFDGSRRVTSS